MPTMKNQQTSHLNKLIYKRYCLYFTDGYADQFGGEKGKKFMYKKLKDLLIQIAHLG
jgi:hypothetical protein